MASGHLFIGPCIEVLTFRKMLSQQPNADTNLCTRRRLLAALHMLSAPAYRRGAGDPPTLARFRVNQRPPWDSAPPGFRSQTALRLGTGRVTRVSLRTHSQLQETILKSTYFASLISAAMLFACAAAYSDDANKDDTQRAPTAHPTFNTVDTHRHGYLTSDDVKNDDYVSKNFDRCNVKHNGHMSRKEYANCHE